MLDTAPLRTDEMPSDMRVLLDAYPRDSWSAHPGFRAKTQQWLNAHQMFRRLGKVIRTETESFMDAAQSDQDYAATLAKHGNALVGNLHAHHGWEDHSYFPELSAADPRFDRGLAILESDHEALDTVLQQFTRDANRVIQLMQLDPAQMRDAAGAVHEQAETIEAFLERHLTDEEELAVPIILHHRLRG